MQIIIDIDENGRLKVEGFPANYTTALRIMQGATEAVCNGFIEKAQAGLLDPAGNIRQVTPGNIRILKP